MLFLSTTFSLLGLCYGIILDCNFKTHDWNNLGNIYLCDAKVIQFTESRTVIGVSQSHLSEKTNDDVTGVRFNDQQLDFVPRNITGQLQNIRALEIGFTALKVITKFDLKQFPDLVNFYLVSNPLEALDGDLFEFTPNLQYLSFYGNKITNVGPNLLCNLKSLIYVTFNGNLCTNMTALNPNEILDLSRRLAYVCPPSAEMIERIVVNGEKLETKLEENFAEKVESVIEELNENVEESERKLKELETQVEELDEIIMEMDER